MNRSETNGYEAFIEGSKKENEISGGSTIEARLIQRLL